MGYGLIVEVRDRKCPPHRHSSVSRVSARKWAHAVDLFDVAVVHIDQRAASRKHIGAVCEALYYMRNALWRVVVIVVHRDDDVAARDTV